MKKILLFVAVLMTAMCAMAQEKFYVYMNDGTTKEYAVAECDSLSFVAPPAPATTGEAKTKDGTMVKWLQLWENGPKFAEYNVGATAVGEYGGYYAWGGSQDKVDDHYTGEEDIQGGDHDTAKNLWGSNWQMATSEELQALIDNCDVVWKTASESGYNVAGVLYTGKGDYSGNSVFFPVAGYCLNGKVYTAGILGYYWSSTPKDDILAYNLLFYSSDQSVDYFGRTNGNSVRAILAE
ncbi:MAG: DUF1566 domain-containing protein [Paludibacteraceae bacterium]|nr:DUF1566 domain-containing protein [Paludibacteraceae bacterium]